MKFDIRAFGLTSGLILGIGLFLFTWWVIIFEGITRDTTIIGMLYRGYNISPGGSIIGFLYGFFDGAIAGVLFAWLYNTIVQTNGTIDQAAGK